MYVVELSFDGDPRRLEARPAHRELLRRLRDEGVVVIAGPWPDDSGAMLVFDTDSAGVEKILADDPYYQGPGVTVVSVREWAPVIRP